jgi:hypothetical protein
MSSTPYQPHWLHSSERLWLQSNCYVDLWIEVLHSLKLDPLASFAFTLTTSFEGDQWTFFKVPHHDLFRLYGIDVQELNIWHNTLEHVGVQLKQGRLVLLEVDAFYLPDVGDTSYRQAHEKTTIAIRSMNVAERTLTYFHNSGYYTLAGDDFDGIFQPTQAGLPLFAELVKLDRVEEPDKDLLLEEVYALLCSHVDRIPDENPFVAYTQHFEQYMASLQEHDLEYFHKYAFANIRQFGASFEYASLFLKWEADNGYWNKPIKKQLRAASTHFESIASNAQAFLLKTARAARTKKTFDYCSILEGMQTDWDKGVELVQQIIDVS